MLSRGQKKAVRAVLCAVAWLLFTFVADIFVIAIWALCAPRSANPDNPTFLWTTRMIAVVVGTVAAWVFYMNWNNIVKGAEEFKL